VGSTPEPYHEQPEELDASTRDAHRALVSLKEEIEAVDWYQQRAACASDAELVRILEHNRREELEHAAMLLEWLRRHCSDVDARLKAVLFSDAELGNEPPSSAPPPNQGAGAAKGRGLGVGSLKRLDR
jgi:ferritin-like protein